VLLAVAVGLLSDSHLSAAPVDFNREIRPILAENCFACHGPDAAQRQAELRLDTREGATATSSGHAAIVPGNVDASELIRRVASTDADAIMPPADSGKKLTTQQIDLLRRWVAEGAQWQNHWAYEKPSPPQIPAPTPAAPAASPAAPAANAAAPAANPIDTFIQSQWAAHGLQGAAPADRVTLIRRLSFDLTGLPPTSAEVERFQNDRSEQAYPRLVERLLASPHYGERMAMYWLDLVRFADTNGYHGDNHRDIWLYRDYVIAAFNDNKPFDRFTCEQLAGDLLPDASRETRIASGYNHLLMTTREGGAQAKEYLAKYSADRVRNASTVWMGATMGCCECHDHKFDPYSTRDFYRFAAFFADLKEVAVGVQEQVPLPDEAQARTLADYDAQLAAIRKVIDTSTPELESAQLAWEADVRGQQERWKTLDPTGAIAASGTPFKTQSSGALLATGSVPPTDVYTVVARVPAGKLSALLLEVLPHKSLPAKGSGRAANGNFVLSEIRAWIAPQANPAARTPLALQNASSDFSQDQLDVARAIDGDTKTGWGIAPQLFAEHVAVFEIAGPPAIEDSILTIELTQHHGQGHNLGQFRLSTTDLPHPVRALPKLPEEYRDILAIEVTKRTPEQSANLSAYYRSIAPALAPAHKQLAGVEAAKAAFIASLPTTLVSMQVEPRTIRVLPRGNWLSDDGEAVTPGVPAFLPPLTASGPRATRLDLAHWLTSPDNPLTARVFVNRLWKLMFGQGLVRSLDDFGAQGTAPSHPELLDWLAQEFVASGWNVKRMLTLMATSATYQQSSAATPEMLAADPYNQWLARQARYRLDAEMVRDQALAVSGLLAPAIGGRSAKPYQPPGYWSHLNFPVREYEVDHGEYLYRRGLYSYWCRTFLHPSLSAFDAPTREECSVDRPRSNTPLQALVLLNDPSYVEAARALAARAINEGGDSVASRLQWTFRTALSREPSERELSLLTDLLIMHLQQYQADHPAADKLLGTGEAPRPPQLDAAEWAAWTSIMRVVLNLHETITRS